MQEKLEKVLFDFYCYPPGYSVHNWPGKEIAQQKNYFLEKNWLYPRKKKFLDWLALSATMYVRTFQFC